MDAEIGVNPERVQMLREGKTQFTSKKGGIRAGIQGLADHVEARMWPTPRANKHTGSDREDFSPSLHNVVGGSLNPDWVEGLMGYERGWTSLSDGTTALGNTESPESQPESKTE